MHWERHRQLDCHNRPSFMLLSAGTRNTNVACADEAIRQVGAGAVAHLERSCNFAPPTSVPRTPSREIDALLAAKTDAQAEVQAISLFCAKFAADVGPRAEAQRRGLNVLRYAMGKSHDSAYTFLRLTCSMLLA